ncbi:serine/threonine protein kinase YCK2 RNJ42_04415 [Nakaseomyces bracarensis]|uniref:serine/threonine protein kinase YCK2 n=1 Tax=Nakaseomyces bracarensis TaxID=273131 RepID=UPI0038727F2D
MSLQQHILTKNHLTATTTQTTTNSQGPMPNPSNVRLMNGNIPKPISRTPSPARYVNGNYNGSSASNTGNTNADMDGSANNNNNNNNTNGGAKQGAAVVGLHYQIGKKIGEGSFGVLFEGTNVINGMPVAIKFEPRKTEAPQLKDEYRTYKILAGTPGIPQAYYFGQEGLHNILVIDLLGPSLEDLFDWCGRKFSVKTVVQIAVQMITLIEDLHAHDLIYRDIKPDNFLIGRPGSPEENNIHLIDFGMAKQYRDPKTKQHIPYREKKSLSGTARYMSINTHLGREQSRRDDMEALGHVFFYFLRGQLPWQGLKAPNNKQKYEKIGEKKRTTDVYDLAGGLPVQFGRYLEIVRNLGFDETPDYHGYRALISSALKETGETIDGKYDWMKLNGGRGWDLTINKKPNLHGYGHPNPPHNKHKQKGGSNKAAPQQTQQENPNREGANLDPTSYEAYQQQTQQKYIQQQQKQSQKNPNNAINQQNYRLNSQLLNNNNNTNNNNNNNNTNAHNVHTGTDAANIGASNVNRYKQQEQPTTNPHRSGNIQHDVNSTGTEKGFFGKLCC